MESYSRKEYPSGDGKPLAETPLHRDNLARVIEMLRRHCADDQSVYISGNMFLYYVQGDGKKHLLPDVFVVRGIGNRYRDRYFVWVEGKGPDIVIEMTSESTREEDLDHKFHLYQDVLRVPEYFLFDPEGEYLDPPLRGYRLVQGRYQPIAEIEGRLQSEVLGLHLERDSKELRLFNLRSGQWVPTAQEVEASLLEEARRADRTRAGGPTSPGSGASRRRRSPAGRGSIGRPSTRARGERATAPGNRGSATTTRGRDVTTDVR